MDSFVIIFTHWVPGFDQKHAFSGRLHQSHIPVTLSEVTAWRTVLRHLAPVGSSLLCQ
jgi:hypothetical protein